MEFVMVVVGAMALGLFLAILTGTRQLDRLNAERTGLYWMCPQCEGRRWYTSRAELSDHLRHGHPDAP